MALAPNFGVSELTNSTGFIFIETTGVYDATNNPGGYGGSNPAYSTAYYAEITIQDALGNIIYTTDVEWSFTLFVSSPSSAVYNTPIMNIPASGYGLSLFVDGVYTLTYSVRQTASGTILGTVAHPVLFYAQTATNLLQAQLNMKVNNSDVLPDAAVTLSTYQALLTSAIQMVQSGMITEPNALITQLAIDSQNLCIYC